jgi:hypothetical protein
MININKCSDRLKNDLVNDEDELCLPPGFDNVRCERSSILGVNCKDKCIEIRLYRKWTYMYISRHPRHGPFLHETSATTI